MSSAQILARAREVFEIEIEGLRKTCASLGPGFTAAVRLILETTEAGGLVVVTGVGKNLHVAEKMSAIFASTGTRSIVLNPVQAMHGDLGMVSPKDLLLALSFSGESEEILKLVPAIRRHGLKIISLTGRADSTLATLSDLHLEIPCGKEACPFGMAPTTSVTATLAMGDALAMVLIDAHKFSVEDYAANHPAGAIGKALILKVSDIMRTGERLAKVAPTATVMETVMAMTKAKGGAAAIAGEDGKLLGIFTDGDFRRIMSGDSQPREKAQLDNRDAAPVSCLTSHAHPASHACLKSLDLPVSEVMTAHPLFVSADAYAADVLKVFERKRIDDLPVCDADGRVVGLVDLQDLPKMKVF